MRASCAVLLVCCYATQAAMFGPEDRQKLRQLFLGERLSPPEPISMACEAHEYTCFDGSCIGRHALCDGRKDCSNYEDEMNCASNCEDDEEEKRGNLDVEVNEVPLPNTGPFIGCVFDYYPVYGKENTEALDMQGLDFTACQRDCNLRQDCVSYEFTTVGSCKMHVWDLEEREGVDFWSRQRCTNNNPFCTESFERIDSHHIKQGVGMVQHETQDDCFQECKSDEDCYGLDFVTRDNPWRDTRCWIHRHVYQEVEGHAVYQKVQCPQLPSFPFGK